MLFQWYDKCKKSWSKLIKIDQKSYKDILIYWKHAGQRPYLHNNQYCKFPIP